MAKILTAILAFSLIAATALSIQAADEGQAFFEKRGCASCHNPTKDQVDMGLGPSVEQISGAYKDDRDGLMSFLKGDGSPRVYPDQFSMMQGPLAGLSTLPEEDLGKLADHILGK